VSRSNSLSQNKQGQWAQELDDLAEAFSGAFIFGMPLLFTMEMWWIGTYTELWRLLIFMGLALAVNTMLAYISGFKEERTFFASVMQAIEAVAVGAVASTVVLLVLNRIALSDPLDSILGKIVIQSIPLSIGASAANAILNRGGGGQTSNGGSGDEKGNQGDGGNSRKAWRLQAILLTLGASIGGGILVGFSIAPTQEVPMLANELDSWHQLALLALTLLMTYVIVFESGFSPRSGSGQDSKERQAFGHPITETILSYIVALLVALVALFLFDQIRAADPLLDILTKVLVLGTPTAIGGAAGRALLAISD
jgi:putative integral membrane protein (TIGR02587 family)